MHIASEDHNLHAKITRQALFKRTKNTYFKTFTKQTSQLAIFSRQLFSSPSACSTGCDPLKIWRSPLTSYSSIYLNSSSSERDFSLEMSQLRTSRTGIRTKLVDPSKRKIIPKKFQNYTVNKLYFISARQISAVNSHRSAYDTVMY